LRPCGSRRCPLTWSHLAISAAVQLRETRKGITQLTVGFRVVPIVLLVIAAGAAVTAAYLLRRSRIRVAEWGQTTTN
jgi:hypothetical protein